MLPEESEHFTDFADPYTMLEGRLLAPDHSLPLQLAHRLFSCFTQFNRVSEKLFSEVKGARALTSAVRAFKPRRPAAVLAALAQVGHLVPGRDERPRPVPPGRRGGAVAVQDVVVVRGGEVVQGVGRLRNQRRVSVLEIAPILQLRNFDLMSAT